MGGGRRDNQRFRENNPRSSCEVLVMLSLRAYAALRQLFTATLQLFATSVFFDLAASHNDAS